MATNDVVTIKFRVIVNAGTPKSPPTVRASDSSASTTHANSAADSQRLTFSACTIPQRPAPITATRNALLVTATLFTP